MYTYTINNSSLNFCLSNVTQLSNAKPIDVIIGHQY